jgi:hypothetical protein
MQNIKATGCIIFCLLCFGIQAQNTNPAFSKSRGSKIEKAFYREMDQYPDSVNHEFIEVQVIWPDTLPEWIFQPLASNSEEFSILGISDPGMDSVSGKELALQRAKALASMYLKTHLGFISEHFVKESKSSRNQIAHVYAQFFELKNRPIAFEAEQVLNQHFTKFGETILLVKFSSPQIISDTMIVIGDALQEEKRLGQDSDIRRRISFFYSPKPFTQSQQGFEYLVKSINNKSAITSTFNQNRIESRKTNCHYVTKESSFDIFDSVNLQKKLVPVDTKYGLWNACIQSVLRSVFHNAFQKSSVTASKLSDDYQRQKRNLKKEATSNHFQINLQRFNFINNELLVDLNVTITN